MMPKCQGLLLITAVIALPLAPARAQSDYPNKPITIVVPTPPGGTLDRVTRLASEKLRAILGVPVVLEYKPGAGLNLGAAVVAHSPPDGYRLLSAPQLTFNADLLSSKLAYNPRGLEPITVMVGYPNVMVARADLPVHGFAEFLSYARLNPDKLAYASQGVGQISHLTFEMLKLMTKIELRHVPYRGSAPAITDILGRQIDLLIDNQLSTDSYIFAGKMKLLAVTGKGRLTSYPNTPTVGEFVPGFVSDTWLAIGAPPGTPSDIRHKLADAFAQALRSPDVQAKLAEAHADVIASSPGRMAEIVRESRERWEPVIQAARIQTD
ncbi:MAG: tripartite tricarboxylate transporter substrate binding protein [Hyphomicrobiales bacterium]|nr:tripartite tricarboxylate transporter substrate binding protein [Hyphomicrobiales bacterium]